MDPITWNCPECGTGVQSPFGTLVFSCDACGYEPNKSEIRTLYLATRQSSYTRWWEWLSEKPLPPDPIPETVGRQIHEAYPQFPEKGRWSGFSLFDILWIAEQSYCLVYDFPLQSISLEDWTRLRRKSNKTPIRFAASISSSDAAETIEILTHAPGEMLPHMEQLLSRFGWSRWSDDAAERLSSALDRRMSGAASPTVISSFSPETQLRLWRRHTGTAGLQMDKILPQMTARDVLSALRNAELTPTALESISFGKWRDADWKAILTMRKADCPEVFKRRLSDQWNALGWSTGTLIELADKNQDVFSLLPPLSESQAVEILRLRPDLASSLERGGAFERIGKAAWKDLICIPVVFAQPIVKEQARKAVLPGLSEAETQSLFVRNREIALLFEPKAVPEGILVPLYLDGTHDGWFDGFDFSVLSVFAWINLLSKCGRRIPAPAASFFACRSSELSTAQIEEMLAGNPELLPFVSSFAIGKLTASTFLSLCASKGAPDYLLDAYPVDALSHETQIDLLRKYPWAEKHFAWKEWPVREIASIVDDNWMLEKAYPHKKRLFACRNWKWITAIAAALLLAVSGSLHLAAAWWNAERQRSIERDNANRFEAAKAESIRLTQESEERTKQAEKESRLAESETAEKHRKAAAAEAKAAKESRLEQESREREATAIAAVQKAEAKAREQEARRAAEEAYAKNAPAKQSEAIAKKAEEDRIKAQAEAKIAEENRRTAEANAKAAEEDRLAKAAEREEQARVRNTFRDARMFIVKNEVDSARTLLLGFSKDERKDNAAMFKAFQLFCDKLDQALAGNTDAQNWIAARYYDDNSEVVPQDMEKAKYWYRRGADGGNTISMRSLGVICKKENNAKEALKWYRKAYEADDWKAGYYYGRMLYRGDGVDKDEKTAFSVFARSAEGGDPDARYYLGLCLVNGKGCKQDTFKGWEEMSKARRLGSKLDL